MRRLTTLLLVFAVCLLCLTAISMRATAQDDDDDDDDDDRRVKICHVISSIERPNGVVFYIGQVIEISHSAFPDHQAHGDVLVGLAAVEGQCCAFTVLADGTILPGQVD